MQASPMMPTNKIALGRCLLVAVIIVLMPAVLQASEPTTAEIDAMRVAVEQAGVSGLLDGVAQYGWSAPRIPSEWFVVHRADPGETEHLQAARNFGASLLLAINNTAPSMLTGSGEPLLAAATKLVDVGAWVGATEGYANFILYERASDVAITGLARLVIDLSQPLSPVSTQLQRIPASWDTPAYRARVIDAEAGGNVLPLAPSSMEELRQVWGLRRIRVRSAALPTPDPTRTPTEMDMLRDDAKRSMESRGIDPNGSDFNSFILDESCAAPGTTQQCWDKKRHELLMSEALVGRQRQLSNLVQFREAVGSFPLEPQRPDPTQTAIRAAFDEAWLPHFRIALQNESVGVIAADIFELVRSGRFVDRDALLLLSTQPTPAVP